MVETGDEPVPHFFRFTQPVNDVVIDFGLRVFERQIFQFLF